MKWVDIFPLGVLNPFYYIWTVALFCAISPTVKNNLYGFVTVSFTEELLPDITPIIRVNCFERGCLVFGLFGSNRFVSFGSIKKGQPWDIWTIFVYQA